MGSRSGEHRAYIAGFIDGDGSLMLQIKKRSDGGRGFRFMTTICLYQDTRHEETLHWIRDVFGIGYISQRNDGMSELRINGYKQVHTILTMLMPYIRFKRVQACALRNACELLQTTVLAKISDATLRTLVDRILEIQNENYRSARRRTKEELYAILGLTP